MNPQNQLLSEQNFFWDILRFFTNLSVHWSIDVISIAVVNCRKSKLTPCHNVIESSDNDMQVKQAHHTSHHMNITTRTIILIDAIL